MVDNMLNSLQKEINQLKKEKNAILLCHNYQPKEVQEIADFIGDSLELCIKATQIKDKEIVVFCGVDFMAETAYILNTNKKILIPDINAECPMANMLPAHIVKKAKEKYPDAAVVLYVNTLAEAKAEADVVCTSANALKIVQSLEEDTILFGPDKNLGRYVSQHTDKNIIPIPEDGYCYVHNNLNSDRLLALKDKYPEAEVLVHPEANKDVQDLADEIVSTGGMMKHVKESDNKQFLIVTEVDMCTRLNNEYPNKESIPAYDDAICETMKFHSLEKIKECLINEEHVVTVSDDLIENSLKAVKRMIELSK